MTASSCLPVCPSPPLVFQPGDLLFFCGSSWQSRIIELATRGPSHVGVIIDFEGRKLLFESTTLCDRPCAIEGKKIDGVQAHDPWERVRDYDGPAYLVPIRARLYQPEVEHLTDIALIEFLGQPYNLRGALGSGPRWLKPGHWLNPDAGSIFCSALAATLLMRVNRMNWQNPDEINPADLLRSVLHTGTHSKPRKLEPGS